jgi:hypothetical protein
LNSTVFGRDNWLCFSALMRLSYCLVSCKGQVKKLIHFFSQPNESGGFAAFELKFQTPYCEFRTSALAGRHSFSTFAVQIFGKLCTQ